MKFKGSLWKIQKDREGEVKIILLVPKTEAKGLMDIPEEVTLDIEITQEE